MVVVTTKLWSEKISSLEGKGALEMNSENEESQAPVDETMDDTTDDGPCSMVTECQSLQGQVRNCDSDASAVTKVELSDTAVSKTSKSLKALLEQQQYEDMRNTSWADLMEEEIAKSRTVLQSNKGEEVAALETQFSENDRTILSSNEEYPSLSIAVEQSNIERRKTSPLKKERGTKSRFKRNLKLTEALAGQALKTDSQVSGKPLRRAIKRDKTKGVQALFSMSTDDEEAPTSSKYQKKRRKNMHREKTVCEASNSRFDSEDLPLSDAERSSRDSSPGSCSSVASTLRIKKGWREPKLGWCRSEDILLRRSKEIEKAKEKPVYAKYLAKVPRHARTKNMPKTPNKYIQYSRRSWDKQVRLWKRRLYEWADEEPTESCLSLNESTADEIPDSETVSSFPSTLMSDENKLSLDEIKVEQDAAASLLGCLDIDTRTNTLTVMKTDDESTLKGTSRSVLGPRDFSQL
ncbi:unnamed protein product [Cercopithifilaria johnstoni]|uniref:Histone RNA hairpin-binding protein RNA-binding domain-containing protein n=1 Tax=Cercopithifilaria johnstoni TaxID=2874296 RepID=A0A8J2MKM9_9BILA|nr:unnamed protein product [Cercopithifilaria johnstoni]